MNTEVPASSIISPTQIQPISRCGRVPLGDAIWIAPSARQITAAPRWILMGVEASRIGVRSGVCRRGWPRTTTRVAATQIPVTAMS